MEVKRQFGLKLDPGTLRVLRNTYPKGAKVEAIRVKDIACGTRGIVVELQDTGDLSVVWNNGERSLVEFGSESVRNVIDERCMLYRKMTTEGCEGMICSECGWNAEVARKRIEKIRNGGMVKDENGILRLVIKRDPVRVFDV